MKALPIALLRPDQPPAFPHPSQAMRSPNGLLAAGGSLAPEWLVEAYANGIFPWYGAGEPILWWSPDPRCVFDTGRIHVSRSLRRLLRHSDWLVRADHAFDAVIDACGAPRANSLGTWLTPAMRAAYGALHRQGHAHSIEVYADETLVGGLYGVATGRVFCGESMFSARSGGSKVALLALARVLADRGWPLLDAQVPNDHLFRLGARMLPRAAFLARLHALADDAPTPASWRSGWPDLRVRDLA